MAVTDWIIPPYCAISIGYTMEKCGICTYVTHRFVVFPEAKPRVKSTNKWVTKVHRPGVTNLDRTV